MGCGESKTADIEEALRPLIVATRREVSLHVHQQESPLKLTTITRRLCRNDGVNDAATAVHCSNVRSKTEGVLT